MAGQTNLQKDVLVLNMEHQLLEIAQNMFDKEIAEAYRSGAVLCGACINEAPHEGLG